MRSLSPDEAALWSRVADTIRPLSREPLNAKTVEPAPKPVSVRSSVRTVAKAPPRPKPKPVPIGSRTLDGSWDKKLRSGSVEPDRVLDLHGMNLDTAWAAIDRAHRVTPMILPRGAARIVGMGAGAVSISF